MLELGVKKERKVKGKHTDDEPAETNVDELTTAVSVNKPSKTNKETKTIASSKDEASLAAESSVKRSRQVLVFGVSVDVNKKQFRAMATKAFRKTDVDLLKEVTNLLFYQYSIILT